MSERVKPISYFKSHASEVIRDIMENQSSVVITLNGEAKVVLQDIREFEKTQESLALLKILAQSGKGLKEGRYRPVREAFRDLRARVAESTKK